MSDQLSPGTKAGLRFGGFLKNNGYVGLAFVASAALMLFMWFCNQMIPFGDRTILRMDLYHQYGPLFAELYERLIGARSLLFSWNSGLGGGFLGNFFNYLASPTGLLVLLFGHENIPEAIGVMVLVKCAFASGAFAHMLRRVHGRNNASIAAFGILYSFCSWLIAYYWNVMWLDAMALLPLVMLGIHNIVRERRLMLYCVTLAITLVTNYYMGFMVCIFSLLFFLVTFFSGQTKADKLLPPPDGRTKHRLKDNRFLRTGFTFACASLLGAALAAFALLPVYFSLKSSSATSGSFPKDFSSYFKIFDFLANHFADVAPTIRSSGGDVLPNIYSGVPAMLLVPLYLFVPSIKGREKVAHVLLLIFMYFSFNTNVLNYIWHAMHFPNDLPYRFSFLYSFLLLWIAYKVFINLKEVPLRAIVGVGAAAALFAVIVEKVDSRNVDFIDPFTNTQVNATTYITLAFIVAYTLVFATMRRGQQTKGLSLTVLMLCCVITEVCAADVKNFEITQLKVNYTTDLKNFQQVKKELFESDGSFFRMELTDLRTRMDPAWYDYPGVSTFSSMAYERTSNLESRLGLGSNFINSYTYNPNTPVYNAMHSLKYLVENQNFDSPNAGSAYLDVLNPEIYKERSEFTRERFTVFENRWHLPVAFWVAGDLRQWDTVTGSDPFLKQGDFWSLAGAGEGVFKPLELRLSDDFYGEDGGLTAYTSEQYVGFSGKPEGRMASIPLVIEVEEARNVYLMADAHYATVHVNKPDGGVANRDHDSQAAWDLGVVTPEEPLSVDIRLNKDEAPASGGFYVYAYGLDMDVFMQGYDFLKAGALDITRHGDTLIEGTIDAPDNGLLYTSIPYDEGWQVSIDGKRVPVTSYVGLGSEDELPQGLKVKLANSLRGLSEKLRRGGWTYRRLGTLVTKLEKPARGGLLGVPLAAGEHTVTLRYVPRGMYGGMMISSAALILLAFAGLIGELLRRRREKQFLPAPPVPEVMEMFSTENLSAEDFSLGEPWEAPPAEEEALPAPEEPQPLPEEPAPPEEEPAPPAQEDEAFELNLPGQPEDEPADTGSASINAILLEMQARAEELRRKMQVESAPEEDDGQSFKLV